MQQIHNTIVPMDKNYSNTGCIIYYEGFIDLSLLQEDTDLLLPVADYVCESIVVCIVVLS